MIAILDANTVINFLKIKLDDSYFKHLEQTFEKVVVTPFVFDEIKNNISKKLVDSSIKEELDSLVYNHIRKFVCYNNYREALDFTSTATNYLQQNEENGEFHSVGYALEESRSGSKEIMQNLLSTHFITDDTPARNEFSAFYKLSLIGKILDTVDVVTLFCLKQLISKRDLIKYCHELKLQYNKEAAQLLYKIRHIQGNDELTSKESQLLTEITINVEELTELSFEKISNLLENPNFKVFFSKYKSLKDAIKDLLASNYRNKIPEINTRLDELKGIYSLD